MEVTEQGSAVRVALITGGCLLVALIGMLSPSSKPAPAPLPSATRPAPGPIENSTPSLWSSGDESRVTFARTMPRANGSQIFNNTGTPNLEMIMVAIPDGSGSVRFVRGSEPEAIRYLEATRAEQERMVVDNGPQDVDTSEIADFGPLKGRATRRARNLAAGDQ